MSKVDADNGTAEKGRERRHSSEPTIERAILVHGAMHASWCWDRVVPRLSIDSVAVDLPGRDGACSRPVMLEGWADTVAEAICSTPGRKLLVAHSMGSLAALATLPKVASHVASLLLVAAIVPAPGQCYWDLFPKIAQRMGRVHRNGELCIAMPKFSARFQLFHDLTASDKGMLLDRLIPEPEVIFRTPVEYAIPDDMEVTYVHTLRDRSVTSKDQRRYVKNLPNRTREIEVDCGHSIMYARPDELAAIINRLADR